MVQSLRAEQEEMPSVRIEDGVVIIEDLLEDDPGSGGPRRRSHRP